MYRGIAAALLGVLLITIGLVACGGKPAADTGAPGGKPAEAAPVVNGNPLDAGKFTLLQPTGWLRMDVPGGVQLYKGNDVVQVQIAGAGMTEADDKAQADSMVKQYNGTAGQTDMLGMKMNKVVYTASGTDQVLLSGIRNGEQVKIQMGGKEPEKNPEVKAIVDSIKLK